MKIQRITLLFAVCCGALWCGFSGTARAQTPARGLVTLPVPKELATPAADSLYQIPVVIIAYLPTTDNENLDQDTTGVAATLDDIGAKLDEMNRQVKFALEEGSRYHGYKDARAKPSLGYKVVACIAVYEKLPRSNFEISPGKTYRPDYKQILTRLNARDFVEQQDVKEFWLWGYHHKDIEPAESNMASPLTGDISNSERTDDLPIFSKTYTLYNYNYGRTMAEAVHDHGHQIEALLSYVNYRQDGNSDLWSKKFMGQDANGKWITGRCGWTHMPPNTIKDYDYANETPVESDIEDWTPDRSGQLKFVNAKTWGSLSYAWPDNNPPNQKTEAQWYIYWQQNIPGMNNRIRYGNELLTNWWRFVGDWDNAIADKAGLHAPA